jgi:LacI family transcriptional regulator
VPVYPNLTIRRYFKDSLVEAGLARLTNWKPDALIIFFNDSSLLQKIRAALPRVPVVAMNALPLDHVDAMVKGSADELISLSLDHFSGNNITNFALFYAGPAEAGQIQKELFEKQLCDHPGKHSYFNSDIDIEEALDTPTDESMEQVGAWLQSLPKPVGIVSPTNHSATHLARVCKHVGLAIPGEIQLIGCDEPAESLESSPHLTTVQLPFDHIGSAALDMAIDLLRGKKPVSKIKIVDGGFLIPRESTGIVLSQLSDIPAAIAYIESHNLTPRRVQASTMCWSKPRMCPA